MPRWLKKTEYPEYPHQILLNQALDAAKSGKPLAAADFLYQATIAGSLQAQSLLYDSEKDYLLEVSGLPQDERSDDVLQDQVRIGWCHLAGIGIYQQSDSQAAQFFETAALQANAFAQATLAWMYLRARAGLAFRTQAERNIKAFEWFQGAARQGLVSAQGGLGWMYLNGAAGRELTKVDRLQKAVQAFENAADQGHAFSQYGLGQMYFSGRAGADLDEAGRYAQAAKWFERAAAQGHPLSQAELGWMYFSGRVGVDLGQAERHIQAIQWVEKGAGQWDALSRSYLNSIRSRSPHQARFVQREIDKIKNETQESLARRLEKEYQVFPKVVIAAAIRLLERRIECNAVDEASIMESFKLAHKKEVGGGFLMFSRIQYSSGELSFSRVRGFAQEGPTSNTAKALIAVAKAEVENALLLKKEKALEAKCVSFEQVEEAPPSYRAVVDGDRHQTLGQSPTLLPTPNAPSSADVVSKNQVEATPFWQEIEAALAGVRGSRLQGDLLGSRDVQALGQGSGSGIDSQIEDPFAGLSLSPTPLSSSELPPVAQPPGSFFAPSVDKNACSVEVCPVSREEKTEEEGGDELQIAALSSRRQ